MESRTTEINGANILKKRKKIKYHKTGFELLFEMKGKAGKSIKDLFNKRVYYGWNKS
jgi:hypothetical protein